jgi:uncharacterized protein YbjT (DUF2867 family)
MAHAGDVGTEIAPEVADHPELGARPAEVEAHPAWQPVGVAHRRPPGWPGLRLASRTGHLADATVPRLRDPRCMTHALPQLQPFMHELHVTVVSPDEAADGVAEFWSGDRFFGFTRAEDGDLLMRIEPSPDGGAVAVSARGPGRSPRGGPTAASPSSEHTSERHAMKIVVIGGSGLIGSKLVKKLQKDGHDPLAASPDTGVDTITGEGLAEALEGAQVVVDVANAPAWEDAAVLDFFRTSARNLLSAEKAAGVGHHVTLSVVGTDRLPESGYLRAKIAQEEMVKAGPIPYTIVRATQFFEFIGRIADSSTDGDTVRLPPALVQPEAADDVASTLADVAVRAPLNDTVELAGPEVFRLDELARRVLKASDDRRQVMADVHARYFGAELDDRSLIPGDDARIAPTRLEDWLSQSAK